MEIQGRYWGDMGEMQAGVQCGDEGLLRDETGADCLCQPSGEAAGVVVGGAERAEHLDAAEGAAQPIGRYREIQGDIGRYSEV